ncbi:MAG: hypothetical protein ACI853_001895 [Paracoccaceae bacterium]|jgi:hypothetical protein
MSSSGPPGELVDMHPDGKTAELNRNINGIETALTPGSAKNWPSQQSCANSFSWQTHCCATVENGMNTPLDQYGYSAMYSSPVGQRVNDYTRAAALMNGLPKAEWLLADTGYDADWFQEVFIDKAKSPVFPCVSCARKPLRTTSGATNGATVSRECSGGSRTGDVWQHATTDAQRSSSRQSPSPQPSYSGYEP